MFQSLNVNVYSLYKNRGSLVLKRNRVMYRINNLENALSFLAEMDQLRLSINTGANQDYQLVLNDHRERAWLLCCTALDKVVKLDVKLKSRIAGEAPYSVFNWTGTVAEFDLAVSGLTRPYRK